MAQPFCLCIAGPNGSGKSTATRGIRTILSLPNWIDPDVVAESVRQELHCLSQHQADEVAFKTARNKRIGFAEQFQDFGFETVFSHPSNIEFLVALKRIGYVVHLYFVCTEDPAINIGRVRNRCSLGGHDVPEERIVDRYWKALANLSKCVRAFDRVVLIDNSATFAPGWVAGEVVNESQTKITLKPRPHLPYWLLRSPLGSFHRNIDANEVIYKPEVDPVAKRRRCA